MCECPVVLRPSAQAASEPWPRLVTAQLQTPSGDTAVLPALCRQQRLDHSLRAHLSAPFACALGHTFLLPGDTGQHWELLSQPVTVPTPAHTIPASSMVNPLSSLPFLGCLPDLRHPSSFSIFIATLYHCFIISYSECPLFKLLYGFCLLIGPRCKHPARMVLFRQ